MKIKYPVLPLKKENNDNTYMTVLPDNDCTFMTVLPDNNTYQYINMTVLPDNDNTYGTVLPDNDTCVTVTAS